LDRFTDIKGIKKETLKRLKAHFEKWLDPLSSMEREPTAEERL
jgi:hypothetical protein